MENRVVMKGIGCLQGKHLLNYRVDTLKGFEDLSPRTLRRFREPHHLCVLNELEEDGYVEAALFIRNLMEENEQVILVDDLGITPRISESPLYINLLREILVRAEERHRDHDPVSESKELSRGAQQLLDLALGRVPGTPPSALAPGRGRGWLWLVRRLLLAALGLAQETQVDGGQREASCRFLYGRFLLEQFPDKDPEVAAEHLKLARQMSNGMTHWLYGEDEGDSAQTLFSVVCLLLRDMYLKMSKEIAPLDPKAALQLCKFAVKRAQEAQNEDKFAGALAQFGHCNVLLINHELALENFNEVLEIRRKENNVYGICEALINMSIALQKVRKIDEAQEYLQEMLSLAEQAGLAKWQAHAFWRLGELMVRGGRPARGAPLLMHAYGCFGGSVGGSQLTDFSSRTTASGVVRQSVFIKMSPSTTSNFGVMAPLSSRRETQKLRALNLQHSIVHGQETVGFLVSSIERESDVPRMLERKPSNIREVEEKDVQDRSLGPTRSSVRVFEDARSSRRVSNINFHSATEMGGRKSSLVIEGSLMSTGRRRRKRVQKESSYFLDDEEDDDVAMSTQLDSTFKDELSHLRCMFGIAKGQEYIEDYFNELSKANTSVDARLNIINWILNKAHFWDKPAEPEEVEELCKPSEGIGEGEGGQEEGEGNEEGGEKTNRRMDSHQVSFLAK